MIHIDIQNTKIPALGFGTYKLKGKEGASAVATALETGYRHIDTAQIYENEDAVGDAVAASGIARGDIFLTTKVWTDRLNDGVLQKSVDESLKKLKTDHVDLLLIHWPNESVPFHEQIKALMDVQKNGKTKLIGVSNFTVAQMREVREKLGAPVVTNQVEYQPYLSQKPVLDYLRAHGMFLTAYSPLAQGRVKGDAVLQQIGGKYGKSEGQIALRWLLQQGVAAIPKAGSTANIKANFDIFDFTLDEAEMQKIHALARPDGRVVNPDFAPKWDKAA